MAPSNEPIDDLLEWHPGTPEAATTNVLRALAWGARRAAGAKLLIFFLWLAYALVAAGGGTALLDAARTRATLGDAVAWVIENTTAGRPPAGSPARAAYRALLLDSLTRQPWVPTGYFVLFYGLLAGGAIAHLHAPRPAPLLAQLGATSGTYAGRFARLLAVAWATTTLLLAAGSLLPLGEGGTASAATQVALLVASLAVVAAIIDYARVRTVARDSRSMVLELARSARFFVRNLPRTLALELLLLAVSAAIGLLAFAAGAALATVTSARTAAFVAAQLLVLGLLWQRLAAWGAMLALYQGLALRRLSR